jgi:hypothetical protein
LTAREGDVDRNLVLMSAPELSAYAGPECGITNEDAKNILFLALAERHFVTIKSSDTTFLGVDVNCFMLSKSGYTGYTVELSLHVESITVFDLLDAKEGSTLPSMSVVTIWRNAQQGATPMAMLRASIASSIRALADSLSVRRVQAIANYKTPHKTQIPKRTSRSIKDFLDSIDSDIPTDPTDHP